jgi:hypothetical protein
VDLSFSFGAKEKKFDKLVVIEIKQEAKRLKTTINRVLKSMSILPTNFSKYCVGISNIVDDIKSNRFKEINLKINKLNN